MSDETPKIEALRIAAHTAHAAYVNAQRAYEQAKCDTYQFQVGDIIKSAKGATAKVTALAVRYGYVRPDAVLQKKDGTFGTRMAPMYRDEWRNPTLHQRAESRLFAIPRREGLHTALAAYDAPVKETPNND